MPIPQSRDCLWTMIVDFYVFLVPHQNPIHQYVPLSQAFGQDKIDLAVAIRDIVAIVG